jgi:UDP-glucose 4-epimerase
MRILITGVDGFLGRAIAGSLIADSHSIIGISDGAAADDRYEFHHIDIAERNAVADVFTSARPKLCIHLAAVAHADTDVEDESRVRRVNLSGALNVADAAKASGCRRMIFFSSAKVLADTTAACGISEGSEPNPVGLYAKLKREVELELLDQSKRGDIEVAIARPVAVIGSGDIKGNYARLARAIGRGFSPLPDGGRMRRSIAFSDRVAERIRRMVQKGFAANSTYVFSDGAFELRDIVDAIRAATGFAWCPPVPRDLVLGIARAVDPAWRLIFGNSSPLAYVSKRLGESFVINASRFEEDFGSLPPLDLGVAMMDAFGRGLKVT